MLFELQIFSELTKKELELLKLCVGDSIKNILLFLCQQKLTSKRKESILSLIKSIDNPPYSLQDSIEWLSDSEYNLLGYSITCSKIDMYDISMTNSTCRDFKNGISTNNILIPGEIENINVVKTKSGKNPGAEMSFLTLMDSTGSVDSVIVFPEQFQTYKNILYNGNVIIVKGNRSKNRDGLIVEKIYLPRS